MNIKNLFVSQIFVVHPILKETIELKNAYLSVLEYFSKKYSSKELWSNKVFNLYVSKFLDKQEYKYNSNLSESIKLIKKTRFKSFESYSYFYCFILDCLFINAFDDENKAKKILEEIKRKFRRKNKNINELFKSIYKNTKITSKYSSINTLYKYWQQNRKYLNKEERKIFIVGTLSAGKSSLINALVGKKINKVRNSTCTSKVHHILEKSYEDNFIYELDHDLELNADESILMTNNEENQENEIFVGTNFKTFIDEKKYRLHLIDSPGVNSSIYAEHKDITNSTLNKEKIDLLIYVFNAEHITTTDDDKYLKYLKNNYKQEPLFLINKADVYNIENESIEEAIRDTKTYLNSLGFENPNVYPISAYAGYLAKIKKLNINLDEDESDEFKSFTKKLSKDSYQFNKYFGSDESNDLLYSSGIFGLEKILYNL